MAKKKETEKSKNLKFDSEKYTKLVAAGVDPEDAIKEASK